MEAWFAELGSHPLIGAVVYAGLALVSLASRQLVRRLPFGQHLDRSFALMAIGLLSGALASLTQMAGLLAIMPYFDALLIGAVAIGILRIGLTLFVDLYLSRKGGAAVSAIFRDVATLFTYFVVIFVVLRTMLDINLASLVATSAVLTAIIGLALQDLLTNIVSGLVLEMESPFSPGDWVRIGAHEGLVQETGWRSTKLLTRVNEVVTLPNTMMSRDAVINYSRPGPEYGDTLAFQAAYEAPPNFVRETVLEVFGRDAAVSRQPPTEVWLSRFAESGVDYVVRYWITDFADLERTRSRLLTNLWYAFNRAGIRIPFPTRDVFVHPGALPPAAPPPDLVHLLRAVPLFAPLDDQAVARLAAQVRRLTFGRGEIVVREGEQGDSFYVIERGTAEVTLDVVSATTSLSRLAPGSFFGEMSLLAGDPRNATVRALTDLTVLVITRDDFRETVMADPALLEPLSAIVAQRQAAREAQRQAAANVQAVPTDVRANQLLERIRAWFGL